jgi:phosphate starvation-inducible PhoH-like protein
VNAALPDSAATGESCDVELVITLDGAVDQRELFGPADANLRALREALDVKIVARDSVLKISGNSDSIAKAASVVETLQNRLRHHQSLSRDDVHQTISDLATLDRHRDKHVTPLGHSLVKPKTDGQAAYIKTVEENDLSFCIGPAGTGKTYLAVAMAVALLKLGKTKRIVLARPAVEAGEKLGYLPGDLQAKVNPYLRPLFDAMHDMLDYEAIKRFMVNDVIEVIPLAFMRGRTLNNSVIILDEAQNATTQQMLMFLTRLGHHSKMIVTGDTSQSDLDARSRSGLIDAVQKLEGVEGIGVVRLSNDDIVRHKLVTRIVNAYEKNGRE